MMNKLIVVLAVLSAAFAQMLLKKGAANNYPIFIKQYLNVWVISGYTLMAISLLININAMRKGVLVKEVGAIESLSYLFVPSLSRMLFKEKIPLRKWIAIAIIIIGIMVFFQ